jgi:signal transduction histidine kinase
VGAVLVPSVALSIVSYGAVPSQAKATKASLLKQAEHTLSLVERDLHELALTRAQEAAAVVGLERLLDGRPGIIGTALAEAGWPADVFESLHLEGSSRYGPDKDRRGRTRRDELGFLDPPPPIGEDWVELAGAGRGSPQGTLRFRYACGYVHQRLIQEYFERDFRNPGGYQVVWVTEPSGEVVYQTAPVQERKAEVSWEMTRPSFRGLKLHLRYKDRTIEQDVRRFAVTKMAMIGFIDLMLGAGLFLVYGNVRREMHLSKLKSDFVANVSHELKTPLALIRLFAETLELGRVQGQDKENQYYRIINKESQRLTQLINNILDFSRIEAGRKEYRFSSADLSQIVDDVLEAYRFPIEQQGFALEVSVAEDLPEVEVDKEAVSLALINLVNNAIKYSRDEKRIDIEVRRDGDRVLISVTDRGIGVARSEQKKIFEKFYRAEDSLVHETKGSGLGLALVRHIMEAHGGEVTVDSALGRGSTFTLALPLGARKAGSERREAR